MSAAAHLYQRGDCRMMAQKIADLEHDCLCLALRLYAVDDSTFAVETAAVMERWRPRCAIELGLAEVAEPAICATCNGSGEGMYDGTRCMDCHGWGIERDREEA